MWWLLSLSQASALRPQVKVRLCHPVVCREDGQRLCRSEAHFFSRLFTQRTNSMRSGGCSSLLMPLERRAEVAGGSRGQCTRGGSHPRVATAVGGAGGGRFGRGRRVLVARLVLLLLVEAEADVALQSGRG